LRIEVLVLKTGWNSSRSSALASSQENVFKTSPLLFYFLKTNLKEYYSLYVASTAGGFVFLNAFAEV
jgi:hypothetical protein